MLNKKLITIERCWCGKCDDYWLVGIGMFVQGSGFTKIEAETIAKLLNQEKKMTPQTEQKIREILEKLALCYYECGKAKVLLPAKIDQALTAIKKALEEE